MPHDRPHPRKVPRVPGELTLEGLKSAFSDCADFFTRFRVVFTQKGGKQ